MVMSNTEISHQLLVGYCEIRHRRSSSEEDESSKLWWSSVFSCSATTRQTFLSFSEISQQLFDGLAMKYGTIFHGAQKLNFHDFSAPRWSVRFILWNISTSAGLIGTIFGANILVPQRMNIQNFGETLTVPLAPPSSWYLWFWVKCLINYWVDCRYTSCRHSCPLQDELW